MIYELEIRLGAEPSVIGKLEVEPGITFGDLHFVLQEAFNKGTSHVHGFFVRTRDGEGTAAHIGPGPRSGSDMPVPEIDEAAAVVGDWLKRPGDEVLYVHDLEAGPEHRIRLQSVKEAGHAGLDPRGMQTGEMPAEEDARPLTDDGSGCRLPGCTATSADKVPGGADDLMTGGEPGAWLVGDGSEQLGGDWDPEYVRAVWTDLLARAKETAEKKPWQQLNSRQLIAVEDPMLDEPVFVSVLGSEGEEFGIVVYYGWEGYAYLKKKFDGTRSEDEEFYGMTGAAVYFEDRGNLTKDDYRLIKDLGYSFRGKKQWPVFRNFEPGYVPCLPGLEEAGLLANILLAVDTVVQIRQAGNEIPEFREGGQMLAFMETDDGMMAPEYIDRPKLAPEPPVPLMLGEEELMELKEMPTGTAACEYDLFRNPEAMAEVAGDRPFYPLISLSGDADTGALNGYDLLPSPQMAMLAQSAFAGTIGKNGILPGEVYLTEPVAACLKPLTDELGLKVKVVQRLGHMDRLKREVLARLCRS